MLKHLKAVASELKLADLVLIILILAVGTISAISVFKTKENAVVTVYKGDRLWGNIPLMKIELSKWMSIILSRSKRAR